MFCFWFSALFISWVFLRRNMSHYVYFVKVNQQAQPGFLRPVRLVSYLCYGNQNWKTFNCHLWFLSYTNLVHQSYYVPAILPWFQYYQETKGSFFLWIDVWDSLTLIWHKQLPNRRGDQHSNEASCTYGTWRNSCQHQFQCITASGGDRTWTQRLAV